ncbi:uncharacterized protein FIESC28_05297 [Fusarium coffeatum]|uniref:Uncharacterized protein n=1 Tax=Fusarium coffeatum TaxID=231269 RepID=A0A366RTD0_9HYPO|nr:uncharacterized protein FIESC28_05297 [Fusarium coffeatum]RBR20333.1 hypothetical protein FIESC28_05297 [Fusarium coffeatum]
MEFELEQDENNPQPIPLQVQDSHIPLDYEHAPYLENLDVSNFPDPGFDFSCLDDADHDEGLASFEEQVMPQSDELHDYFSQVDIPAEIDLSLLQPPEEHLIEPFSETLDFEPLSYEAIIQDFVPPTPSRMLHPPFLQISHQSGQICKLYLPNNEPQPFTF